MKTFDRLPMALVIACSMFVAAVLVASFANAATPSDVVHAACSSTGQAAAIWLLGAVGVGNIVAWFDRSLAKSPAWVQAAVHFVALHWPKILVDLGVLK